MNGIFKYCKTIMQFSLSSFILKCPLVTRMLPLRFQMEPHGVSVGKIRSLSICQIHQLWLLRTEPQPEMKAVQMEVLLVTAETFNMCRLMQDPANIPVILAL